MSKYLMRVPYLYDAIQWSGRNKKAVEKFLGITHVIEYDGSAKSFRLDYDDVCRKGDYLVREPGLRIRIYKGYEFKCAFVKARKFADGWVPDN